MVRGVRGVEGVGDEHGIVGEEVFVGNIVEQLAGEVQVAEAGVEGEEVGGEEVGGDDGVEEEAGVELASDVGESEVVVGAVVEEEAKGTEVERVRWLCDGGEGGGD